MSEKKNDHGSSRGIGFRSARKICVVALFTALNVALSSFSITVPGGHLYLNDVAICFAALFLDPLSAFIVGGAGAFLGDLLFYPAAMFVSLVSHGLEAIAISLIAHGYRGETPKLWRAIVGVLAGAILMVAGYTVGRAYTYGTWQSSMLKLPFEILQAGTGAVAGTILFYATPLRKIAPKVTAVFPRPERKSSDPQTNETSGSE